MNNGYIYLQRKIQDCWIWQDESFSRGQAWIDLLLLAEWKDRKKRIGNELVTIKRGSFHLSILMLASRWKWSRNKVRRFLELLENDNMITTERTPHGTTVTIAKYEDYQAGWTPCEPTHEPPNETTGEPSGEPTDGTTGEPQMNKDNKDNKSNKGKKIIKEKPPRHQYGRYKNVLLSDDDLEKLKNEFPNDWEKRIEDVSEYCEGHGKSYSNYLATIRNWARRDKQKGATKDIKGASELDAFYQMASEWGNSD